jgi:transcriptional regulator with XRE-family HTH domain
LNDDIHGSPVDHPVVQALGEEIRRAREGVQWTRDQLVKRLGDVHVRTVASYERGDRLVSLTRLLDLCRALKVAAPDVITLALQRTKTDLSNLALMVDLHAILRNRTVELRPLRQWAVDQIENVDATGVVRLAPATVADLASSLGYERSELAEHLLLFTPDRAPRRE